MIINYANYSNDELLQANNSIDKNEYPDNYNNIVIELKKRDPKFLDSLETVVYERDMFSEYGTDLTDVKIIDRVKRNDGSKRFDNFFKNFFQRKSGK